MSDKMSGKSIVPSGKTDLTPSGRGGNRLIKRAASDALVPMNSVMNRPEPILHRVGTREFHEEDFRQLQIWASEIGMEGRIDDFVEAVDRIFRERVNQGDEFVAEYLKNNLDDWCYEGRIKFFAHFDDGKLSCPKLSQLTYLGWGRDYDAPKQEELILSFVPSLEVLDCRHNGLTTLDLPSVSALTQLWCYDNELTDLDLSAVPVLTDLWCESNLLAELDLSSVPNLTQLECSDNLLTELDLSSIPNLKLLGCGMNQLTELDLSAVPNLMELHCGGNQLAELELSPVPGLKQLNCASNQLIELDLSAVPDLKELQCSGNPLTKLGLFRVLCGWLGILSCEHATRCCTVG